ncbi:MAG: fibrobacter succinogenes major paralogous domain-containing protein [Chitinispirillales bacterium]|jgi:uncharacterized protein (TIGR02145 family)|nr:fibrobacter succinogenes major paralogous domain-containing protein [Chitinispirillales bacterium]
MRLFNHQGRTLLLAATVAGAVCFSALFVSGCGGKDGKGASDTLSDTRDGQKYRTVKIGGGVWMAENLNFATGNSWCYDNDDSKCKQYGRLYDWETAKAACPAGWHLPSSEEWADLVKTTANVTTVTDEDEDGNVHQWDTDITAKELKSKSGWDGEGNGYDTYGFSALPGGARDTDGKFKEVGARGYWWKSSDGKASGIIMSSEAYESRGTSNDLVLGLEAIYDMADMWISMRCVMYGGNSSTTGPTTPTSAETALAGNKCGENGYDPETQFCHDGNVTDKCGGNSYNPKTHGCAWDGNKERAYDRDIEFGYVPIGSYTVDIYKKCGGKEYNPATQFCENNNVQDYKCDNKKYNAETQFCHQNTLYNKCVSELTEPASRNEYNPDRQQCRDGQVIDR